MTKTLAQTNVKTLCDTLGDVEGEALFYTRAETLAWVRPIDIATHVHTLAEALKNTLACTLDYVMAKPLATQWVVWIKR